MPTIDLDGARKAGYSDAEILGELAKSGKIDLAGARKAGYSDSEILKGLAATKAKQDTSIPDQASKFIDPNAVPAAPAKPVGIADRILGVPDAALALGSSIASGAASSLVGIVGAGKSVVDGTYGTQQGVRNAEELAGKWGDALQYQPRTQTGQAITGAIGEAAAPLAAIGGHAEFQALGQGTRLPRPSRSAGLLAKAEDIPPAVRNIPEPPSQPLGLIANEPTQTVRDFTEIKTPVAPGAPTPKANGNPAGLLSQKAAPSVYEAAPAPVKQAIDQQVTAALQKDGIDTSSLGESIIRKAKEQTALALQSGETPLSPSAIARQERAKSIGVDLLTGQSTRDAELYGSQFEAAKLRTGRPIANALVEQENKFRGLLDTAGAKEAPGQVEAGRGLISAIKERAEDRGLLTQTAYDQAKSNGPQGLLLDKSAATSAMGALKSALLDLDDLPANAKRYLTQVESGELPLTVANQQQIVRHLGDELRGAQGSAKTAIGIVRDHFDNAEPVSGAAAKAVDEYKQARGVARGGFQEIDDNPIVQAILKKDAEPDKLFHKFILNGSEDETASVMDLIAGNKKATKAVQDQLVEHLNQKMFGGDHSGDAASRQAAYNKEIDRIGMPRLTSILGAKKAEHMRTIGQVASDAFSRPARTLINDANSGSLVKQALEDAAFKRIPVIGGLLADAKEEIQGARFAKEATSGLLAPTGRRPTVLETINRTGSVPPIQRGGLLGPR